MLATLAVSMVLAAKVGKCSDLALVLDFSANLCLVLEFVLLFLWRRKRSGGRGPPSAGKNNTLGIKHGRA